MKRSRQGELKFIVGDLLQCHAQYLVHQVNATTIYAAGLAHQIFTAYPSANNYYPINKNVPGKCMLYGRIVNLCGQWLPGKPFDKETFEQRLIWFKNGLKMLASSIAPNATVAFPVYIGCGLAGGKWEDYLQAIYEWHDAHPSLSITLVHRTLRISLWTFTFSSDPAKLLTILVQVDAEHSMERDAHSLLKEAKQQAPLPLYLHQPLPNGVSLLSWPHLISFLFPIDECHTFLMEE